MSPEQTMICNLERAFPILIVGGLFYVIARKLHLSGVAKFITRLGVALLLVVVLVAALGELHHVPIDTRSIVGGWLALGLPIYLVKRWRDGADARTARADALRQARGQARHRAPPPAAGAPSPPNPTQTTGSPP